MKGVNPTFARFLRKVARELVPDPMNFHRILSQRDSKKQERKREKAFEWKT